MSTSWPYFSKTRFLQGDLNLLNHSLQLNPETACTVLVSDFNLPSIKWSLDESTSTNIGGAVEDVAFCDIMEDNFSKVPHILLETNFYVTFKKL